MIKSGLESKKEWADNHPEYYDNKEHQELVKLNIEIRYRCVKMMADIDKMFCDDTIQYLWYNKEEICNIL